MCIFVTISQTVTETVIWDSIITSSGLKNPIKNKINSKDIENKPSYRKPQLPYVDNLNNMMIL